jgi:hypothetical protein
MVPSASVYFVVDDVDSLHELHARNGVAIHQSLEDKPWVCASTRCTISTDTR